SVRLDPRVAGARVVRAGAFTAGGGAKSVVSRWGFAGAWCGAFPGGLLAGRVAPLAFLTVRWCLRLWVTALRARVSVPVACRALGRCGGLPRWWRGAEALIRDAFIPSRGDCCPLPLRRNPA